MAGRSRQRVRVTPLGYIVLSIIIVVMIIGIYFIIWSMRDDNDNPNMGSGSVSITPTPSLPPADGGITPTPSLAPVAPSTPTASPTPNAPETPTPTPKQPDTPVPDVQTPSPSQLETAVNGKLTSGGVVLRKGPAGTYDILGKYSSGTRLKVYAQEGDYYYVQVIAENKYGYMAVKFIEKDGLLPGESATPTPAAPGGAIAGTARTTVALRSMPTTEGNSPVGQLQSGDAVYVYFKTGDFYYIEVVSSKLKCYAFADYITPEESVPSGTPEPD